MSFWRRLFGRETKMTSLELFNEVYGGRESNSGVVVDWKKAVEVSTVLACVRSISNGVSQVPWPVYQSDGERRAVARDHPLYPVLAVRPNSWQTSFTFRETIMFHVLLTGNAFVWKGMVGRARKIVALEPIDPGRVTVAKENDALIYKVRADDGAVRVIPADEIWHIRGPSWNNWMGMDAVKLARDAIGLSIATETAHADMHKGNPRVSGLLSMQEKIGPEKFEFLSKWLDKHAEGGDRAGKPMILDGGAKYTPFGMTGVDAQHLETRKHQIEEICREFGVMPIMVGHADKTATYASAEQMFLAHVVHTLDPWYRRLEQSADADLLSEEDRADGYYTKFTTNALMRGAAADRAAFYVAALGTTQQPGWMTKNEVRALEEMDPVEDGDKFPDLITTSSTAGTPESDDDGTN